MDDEKRNYLIIEELRKRKGKETTIDVEEDHAKVVIFALHDGLYAFPGVDVKEILPFMDIFPVPGAPDFIPGVINNRGDIESVINLNKLLGLPDSNRTESSRIAMASKRGLRSGILVDAVLDVIDVPLKAIAPPLPTLDSAIKDLVIGEMTYNSRTVVMIDVGSIFDRLVIHDE